MTAIFGIPCLVFGVMLTNTTGWITLSVKNTERPIQQIEGIRVSTSRSPARDVIVAAVTGEQFIADCDRTWHRTSRRTRCEHMRLFCLTRRFEVGSLNQVWVVEVCFALTNGW